VSSSQNLQDKKINQKQNNFTHFVFTLRIPQRISSLSNFSLFLKPLSLSQTSLTSSLSSSNIFIVFSLSLSFSNLFRASSLSFSNLFSFFLCFWITHTQHHGEHQIFSFFSTFLFSLFFSRANNTSSSSSFPLFQMRRSEYIIFLSRSEDVVSLFSQVLSPFLSKHLIFFLYFVKSNFFMCFLTGKNPKVDFILSFSSEQLIFFLYFVRFNFFMRFFTGLNPKVVFILSFLKRTSIFLLIFCQI